MSTPSAAEAATSGLTLTSGAGPTRGFGMYQHVVEVAHDADAGRADVVHHLGRDRANRLDRPVRQLDLRLVRLRASAAASRTSPRTA